MSGTSLLKLIPFISLAYSISTNITAVLLPGGCSAYPSYDATTGIAGPWVVQAVQTNNSAIENFGNVAEFSRGATQIRWGSIVFPTNNQVAKNPLRCSNNTLQALVPVGVSQYEWQNLRISPYPYDAELMYLVDGGPEVQPYAIYVDGVQQPGVFLGADATTTWGFRYYPADASCCGTPFYGMRLLGPKSADPTTGAPLQDGEFKGLVKVNSS
jgi:hypothetical protein